MLRLLAFAFTVLLVVNVIGMFTGAIPEDTRLLFLAIGGLGLFVVAVLERRGDSPR